MPGSEELAAVPEGEDDEEEERGDGGDEQEGPEQPPVHRLRQHPPLSPDLIVLTFKSIFIPSSNCFNHYLMSHLILLVLLVEQAAHHPHQVVLVHVSHAPGTRVHADDVQLGAGGQPGGGGRHLRPVGAAVAEDAAHHAHEVVLVGVLGPPPAGVLAVRHHDVGVGAVPDEGVLLHLGPALALGHTAVSTHPTTLSSRGLTCDRFSEH